MRNCLLLVLLLFCFLALPSSAQIGDWGGGGDCGGDSLIPCDSGFGDEAVGGDGTLRNCKMYGGCPMCSRNHNTGETVCSVLPKQSGYCKCDPKGTIIDRWGNRVPNCVTEGQGSSA